MRILLRAIDYQQGNERTMNVEPAKFRAALRNWASGVALVTASEGSVRVGLTVSAFASLSLNPPLVLVCIDRHSTSLPTLERAGCFAVNILGADQAKLAQHFATKAIADKFITASWGRASTGAPVLDAALAWLDCKLNTIYAGGDHLIIVGGVVATRVNSAAGTPLLYAQGRYNHLALHEDAYTLA